eukprot:8648799-Ditylum_brightwellii.AAC.1
MGGIYEKSQFFETKLQRMMHPPPSNVAMSPIVTTWHPYTLNFTKSSHPNVPPKQNSPNITVPRTNYHPLTLPL